MLEGSGVVDDQPLEIGTLLELGGGRTELPMSGDGGRVMVLGGEPLGEPLLLWWNFVLRSSDEVVQAREDWEAQRARFGEVVGYDGSRVPAPSLDGARLLP